MTRSRRIAAAVLTAAAVATAAGCGSALVSGGAEYDEWLREMGFQERASWPSTVLHRGRRGLPAMAGLSSVLEGVPELTVTRPIGADWGLVRRRPDGERCALTVAVNGTPVSRAVVGGDWTVDFLARTRDVVGLEVHYGDEGPLLDPTGCGSVLIWTRSDAVVIDGPFRGGVVGVFWGGREGEVTEVVLEPSGALAAFDRRGDFSFKDVLPGVYDVVVRAGDAVLGRERVRVFAYAESRLEVPLEPGA